MGGLLQLMRGKCTITVLVNRKIVFVCRAGVAKRLRHWQESYENALEEKNDIAAKLLKTDELVQIINHSRPIIGGHLYHKKAKNTDFIDVSRILLSSKRFLGGFSISPRESSFRPFCCLSVNFAPKL